MTKNRQKGLALIVTMGVLLVLSTVGVTFIRVSSYERTAASNYKDRIEAKLAAFAGVDHGVAVLFEQARQGTVGQQVNGVDVLYPHASGDTAEINGQTKDIFELDNAIRGGAEATPPLLSLHQDEQGPFSYSGLVGRRINGAIRGTYEDNGNLYGLKIINVSGRLNVNSHISVDQNGNVLPAEQQDSNRIMRGLLQTLAEKCSIADPAGIAATIRPDDSSVPNFTMNSLEEIIGTSAASRRFLANLCVNSRINPKTAKASLVDTSGNTLSPQNLLGLNYRNNTAPQYVREMRAAININDASLELIETIIQRTKAMPTFLLSRVDRSLDATFALNTVLGVLGIQKETAIEHRIPRLEIKFSPSQASQIAQFLVGKDYKSNAEINEEIDLIEKVNASDGIDAPELSLLDSSVFFPALPVLEIQNLFGIGKLFGDSDSDLVKIKLLWKRACRDVLKSSFNPNITDNFWNPNIASKLLGVKANLFGREDESIVELVVGLNTKIVNHHTTELTAFDDGVYEITSSSRITANNGNLVTGACTFRTDVRLFDILEHSTQEDFVASGNFGNTISFPGRHNTNFLSSFSGRVEPRPQLINPINDTDVLFNTGSASESSAPNNSDHFLGTNNSTLTRNKDNQTVKIKETNNVDTVIREENILAPNIVSNIVNDGLISLAHFYESEGIIDGLNNGISGSTPVRYYSKYALDNAPIGSDGSSDSSGNNSAALRDTDATGNNADQGLNNHRVGNYEGTIEFWIKLAVDGDSPTECGILSFSTIGEEKTGPANPEGTTQDTFREGTQTFLVKDTKGHLKLTRYYFCGYFGKNNLENATIFNRNGDIERRFAKRDISLDVSNWKANTWHHIIINWDDKAKQGDQNNQGPKFEANNDFQESLSLKADNQTAGIEQSYFGIAETTAGVDEPRFVVCAERDVFGVGSGNSNEGNGLNYLLINGIFRRQNNIGNSNKFFQHNTGVYLGNATIDNVISYRKKLDRNVALNRFNPQSTYTNSFAIPEKSLLGTLRWVAYNNNNKYNIDVANIFESAFVEASATLNGASAFESPASKADKGGDGSGLPASGTHIANEGDALIYEIVFETPSNAAGAIGSVCAALDSVQLTVLNIEHLSFDEIQ